MPRLQVPGFDEMVACRLMCGVPCTAPKAQVLSFSSSPHELRWCPCSKRTHAPFHARVVGLHPVSSGVGIINMFVHAPNHAVGEVTFNSGALPLGFLMFVVVCACNLARVLDPLRSGCIDVMAALLAQSAKWGTFCILLLHTSFIMRDTNLCTP
jgi:hypothetical protein